MLTSSGEPQKATLTSTGLLPLGIEVLSGDLLPHPEFTVIKEHAAKTKIEDLIDRIAHPYMNR
ncbi:MAG: hypothetical protein Q8R14_03375 [Candidatus Omnitrophota bacterium]|nr:hypothetical protein [Candidatus Omnitrophota bacterium]